MGIAYRGVYDRAVNVKSEESEPMQRPYERVERVIPARVEVEERVIPETTEVRYVCSLCEHVSDSECAAQNHHARAHTVAERREVAGYPCFRFETEASYKAFQVALPSDGVPGDEWGHSHWEGPGWYVVETYPDNVAGEDFLVACLLPVAEFCEGLRQDIENLRETLREVEEAKLGGE